MANSFFVSPVGVKQPAFSDLSGAPTVSQGVPSLITASSVNLTGQTATIGTTTLYAVPSSAAGLYRVSYSLIDTTIDATATLTLTIGWNNGTAAQTVTTSVLILNLAGSELAGEFVLKSASSQNITYATTVATPTGTQQYSLSLRVEYLG